MEVKITPQSDSTTREWIQKISNKNAEQIAVIKAEQDTMLKEKI